MKAKHANTRQSFIAELLLVTPAKRLPSPVDLVDNNLGRESEKS